MASGQSSETPQEPSSSAAKQRADEGFFLQLPELTEFREVAERARYADAPASWHVVITDVHGSTSAIEAGRYKDVNALGVASIVALRNAIPDVELPYVFGGDGATLLVPGSRVDACCAALRGVRHIARESFGMELRAAHVPVSELREDGHAIAVAKFRASPHVRLAMFAGGGFSEAERRVKSPEHGSRYSVPREGETSASLEGFECRWQPVESRRGQIVSLLVSALGQTDAESANVYREVIRTIEGLTGESASPPISLERLRLSGLSLESYDTEARLRSGQSAGAHFEAARRSARKQALFGRALMRLGRAAGGFDGASYRRELLANTDFRKFDETLRMVIDLSEAQLTQLRGYLELERGRGTLVYGLHCSGRALVTCFVRSYAGDHVHFVDGANGGYALAARELKAQLRALSR